MPPIFLATLGQRPEAITVALDALMPQYGYQTMGLIVTDRKQSGIAGAYQALRPVLRRDYLGLELVDHELCIGNGNPIIDINTPQNAEAYFRSILAVFKSYREQNLNLHLLVAGGRKAMSIYATLAASLVFGTQDIVWTVLSSPELVKDEQFHIPLKRRHEVTLVHLPIMPSRFLPGILADISLDDILAVYENPRERFLNDLTPIELELVNMVVRHPYAPHKELGKLLKKSHRTVENQLNKIYIKMLPYFELNERHKKKDVLVDVMAGRL